MGTPGRSLIFAGALFASACAPRPDTTVLPLTAPPAPPTPDPDPDPTPPPPTPPRSAPITSAEDGPSERSDGDLARARELFLKGAEAYDQGQFVDALTHFQAAYDLVPARALLFNIASCELRLRDLPSACAHFRQYVADGDPSDPRVQQVSAQVASRCGASP